jgi:hypothetical protein
MSIKAVRPRATPLIALRAHPPTTPIRKLTRLGNVYRALRSARAAGPGQSMEVHYRILEGMEAVQGLECAPPPTRWINSSAAVQQ